MKTIGQQELKPTGRNSVIACFQLDFNDPAGTYAICPVRPGQIVIDVCTNVRTAFNATSPTATIGDAATPAGYLTNANIALATAATPTTPAVKRSIAIGGTYAAGKVYSAADTVNLTWNPGAGGTAGRLVGYVELMDLTLDSLEA